MNSWLHSTSTNLSSGSVKAPQEILINSTLGTTDTWKGV